MTNNKPPEARLLPLALSFLRLGTLAFGGPVVHLSMMRAEFIQKRQWITEKEFMDRLALANLIPGPSSTEVAIHIGYLRGGWPGLFLAGLCFIAPAFLSTALLAALYVRFGSLPQTTRILSGVTPVVVAIIAQTVWGMGRSSLKSVTEWSIALFALLCFALGLAPLPVLAMCGILSVMAVRLRTLLTLEPLTIFLTFAKIGSLIFGSGYVLLAFLQEDMVTRTHWLTSRQLLDAVAVGQITPGPVFSTATFLGYLLGGWPGAIAATAGIFAPAFFFVGLSGVLMDWLRRSVAVSQILSGVAAGSLALIAYAGVFLGRAAVNSWFTAAVLAVSALCLIRWKTNTVWLVFGGAIAGAVASRL